ncbi:hypothetical protein Tco_0180873 [Tanacetum coccineum]
MRKRTLDKTHKCGLGTCVALLWRCVHFNRMIDEKFGKLDVGLRGLEKRKERKECLQEVRNTKVNGGDEKRGGKLDRRDDKINGRKRGLCEGKIRLEGLKMKNKDDEDKDEIKGLIWVNNHIANKKGKSGMVLERSV